MTFNEMDLKKEIKSAIAKAGYKEPSPIQERAIPLMLEGRDMIACAQTGTGKTAAFALPILQNLGDRDSRMIRALVLTPTRELAVQIFDNFKKYGRYLKLRTAVVYGGAKQGPQIAAIGRGCDILVATPGRLMDYMERGIVSLADIQMFVLDEADRMLDMGFIGDIRKIAKAIPAERQTALFSATMPKEIRKLAEELLQDPDEIEVAPESTPAETVDQKICFTERDNKKLILKEFLDRSDVTRSIVFTRTKRGADRLVRELKKLGINSTSIHGDKTQGQRQSALEHFRSGKVNVLVATDVAARGLDIPKISHVFNYDLPEEAESYIHRIGRAGRAGQTGEAISLCSEDEMGALADIERLLKNQIEELKTEWSIVLERKTRGFGRKRRGNFARDRFSGDRRVRGFGRRNGGMRTGEERKCAEVRENAEAPEVRSTGYTDEDASGMERGERRERRGRFFGRRENGEAREKRERSVGRRENGEAREKRERSFGRRQDGEKREKRERSFDRRENGEARERRERSFGRRESSEKRERRAGAFHRRDAE
ncbi:DEAD/DEAH box helicase [[Clostridium] aminophilum]|uniref:DEAD/DEAH box helicase n=1 Tax=[Clostridium] aminophilum TaxID=1526 RepID=UPI00331A5CA6